jgi:hypothetical protein
VKQFLSKAQTPMSEGASWHRVNLVEHNWKNCHILNRFEDILGNVTIAHGPRNVQKTLEFVYSANITLNKYRISCFNEQNTLRV